MAHSRFGRTFVAGCALLAALIAPPATADSSKLDPLARRALQRIRQGVSAEPRRLESHVVAPDRDPRRRFELADGRRIETRHDQGLTPDHAQDLDVFIVGTASRAALEAAGAIIRTELPGIATAFVPADAVERVAALAGVTGIRGAQRVRPALDVSVPTTGASFQRGVGPAFAGRNGSGVVIGIVDTGIDVDHDDFRNADGTTRLLRVWDQSDAAGPPAPGFGYGTEWTASDINAHIARVTDEDGHGTHVLGIAGGDGSATGGATPAFTYAGVAPRADLMVVKCTFTTTSVLDGVAFVMNRAAALGKPAVVNLSLGTLFGPKDGTSPFETALDALTGPGRIIVVAAGNQGGTPYHSEVTVGAGATLSTTMNVTGSAAGATVAIDGYYEATGNLAMSVTAPNGASYGPVSMGGFNASYPGVFTPFGYLYFENGAFLTATGDREMYVELNVPYPNVMGASMNGTWTFTFINVGGVATHDETTEDLTGPGWNAAAGTIATPGTAGFVTGSHLLLSEIGWRGLNDATRGDSTEFIEIHNPTSSTIDLSRLYLTDVNYYATLPTTGVIGLAGASNDFAMRFPAGATIGPGQTRVIAIDGGRWKRATGADADFMMWNAGGATSAQPMIDVSTSHGFPYPAFDALASAGELVWMFSWDGVSDLVCDVDCVYWGVASGGNAPARKSAGMCQDGPDAGSVASCYRLDLGNPTGTLGRSLALPGFGAGTRQRSGAEGAEASSGNGCVSGFGSAAAAELDAWIFYNNIPAAFALGNQPGLKLVAEPGNATQVITVGAWVTKNRWTDCGGRTVGYSDTPQIGSLAWFSSPGPTRDGREKPDLVAPGEGIASSTTFDLGIACPDAPSSFMPDGMQHWIYEGTSMAAPHVSGAIALLMQKRGPLTPDQVRAHLKSNAIKDGFTGPTWTPRGGHGKLFVGDLTDPTARVVRPNGAEVVSIGSMTSLTWSALDGFGDITEVDLELARTNGGTFETIARGVPNSGFHPWTVTGPATSQARIKVTARDNAGNIAFDLSDGLFGISAPLDAPDDRPIAEYGLTILSGNPARGPVDLSYSVPSASGVDVTVHDLAGRRVATLAGGAHAAGRYRARWTPSSGAGGAANGIYFVRLAAPGRELTRRLAITR